MKNNSIRFLLVVSVLLLLTACANTTEAPVDTRPTDNAYKVASVSGYGYEPEPVTKGYHTVVKGDTLYSIAWRYGLDYRDIAGWNNVSSDYVIYPEQRLRLTPDPQAQARIPEPSMPVGNNVRNNPNQLIIETVKPSGTTEPLEPESVKSGSIKSQTPKPNSVKSTPVLSKGALSWKWPTSGELLRSNSPVAQKGVDITGREGQQVLAAEDGVVVYSGSGLLGYGKLIIIKHNETYLSAYAHNQMMQVKEGDMVNSGQVIGTMGKGNKGQPLLHFEIRKDGKPVDPLQYLPARS